ncbi:MAG: UDP-N-acetylmuramoyl-L-alanine--D-glutamate ligase [Rhizobiaceae bacterium]
MIAVTLFDGQKVALFGLGGSGLITAQALQAGGAQVVAFDDNPASVEKAAASGISTGDLRQIDWNAIHALILAPGVPLTHPQPHWSVELALKAGVEVIGDIELFSRMLQKQGRRAPFVAITGTNGKSTTTALISHVLASAGRDVQMGGNIGRAVLDLDPLSDTPANQVYVVECSSYQIDLAPSLQSHVGVLLNVTPDHLERHGTIENYAAIKQRLVAASDVAVVGVDDEFCVQAANQLDANKTPMFRISGTDSAGADIGFDDSHLIDGAGQKLIKLAGIGSLRGQHNGQNAAACLAVCQALGLSEDEVLKGFQSFPGLAHRMEQVGTVADVLFINDSKATNAEAAAPALSSFDKVHWIAGGLAKDGGIEALAPHFPRVAKAYLIGEAAGMFAAQLGDTIPYEIAGTLQQAVNHAARDAASDAAKYAAKDASENPSGMDNGAGSVVLLSPAAASFDQFPNFEKRGEAFKDAVAALAGFKGIED